MKKSGKSLQKTVIIYYAQKSRFNFRSNFFQTEGMPSLQGSYLDCERGGSPADEQPQANIIPNNKMEGGAVRNFTFQTFVGYFALLWVIIMNFFTPADSFELA